MLTRLKSLFKKQQELQNSPFNTTYITEDIIKLIATKLDNESMAKFSQTNKKIHDAVEKTLTYLEQRETKIEGTYSQIRNVLNENNRTNIIQNKIDKIEGSKFSDGCSACCFGTSAFVGIFGGLGIGIGVGFGLGVTSLSASPAGLGVALGISLSSASMGLSLGFIPQACNSKKDKKIKKLHAELNKPSSLSMTR